MKFAKTTAKTVARDLRAFAAWLDAQPPQFVDKRQLADWFNTQLDKMVADNAFGTEGQFDPRGDHRG